MISTLNEAERPTPLRVRTAAAAITILAGLSAGATAWAADAGVNISGFAFKPRTMTVALGSTITWVNEDNASHIIADKAAAFRSEKLGKGDKFSQEFSQAGSFDYFCAIHPNMKGKIVVTP